MIDFIGVGVGAAAVVAALGYYYKFRLTDVQREWVDKNLWPFNQATIAAGDHEQKASTGNVQAKSDEWDVYPDISRQISFPSMDEPETRYEDFNRRLYIFRNVDSVFPKALPPRDVADKPQSFEGSEADLNRAIDRQLVGSYHVIIDRTGLFAAASRQLELNPFYNTPLIETFLELSVEERPVVISFDPPVKNASHLTFRRWGFHGQDIPMAVLNQYSKDSLSYILDDFLGTREEWLWFSVARLRHFVVGANRPVEEARMAIAEKLASDPWARLWGLKEEATEDEATAEEDEGENLDDPAKQVTQ